MFLRFILVQQLYGRKEVQSASLQVTYKNERDFSNEYEKCIMKMPKNIAFFSK